MNFTGLELYALLAFIWAIFATYKTHQTWGSEGRLWAAFFVNFALFPYALWRAIKSKIQS